MDRRRMCRAWAARRLRRSTWQRGRWTSWSARARARTGWGGRPKSREQGTGSSLENARRSLLLRSAVDAGSPDEALDPLADGRVRREKVREVAAAEQRLHDEQMCG